MSIFNQLISGKSPLRAFMNQSVWGKSITGNVLDIGAGENASYYTFFDTKRVVKVDTIDNFKGNNSRVDLENPPTITSPQYQHVLCFNLLEHLYHPKNCLNFAYQNLISGGHFIGFVPFMIKIHPDPHDYHRYSREAIAAMLTESKFKNIKVTFIGLGPLTASLNLTYDLYPKLILIPLSLLIIFFDKLLLKLSPSRREVYPLGYLFEAVK